MGDSLRDKIIVVTGAGGGIGSVTAAHLAEEGTSVFLTDLPQSSVEETAQSIRDRGLRARAVAADLSVESEIAEIFEGIVSREGRIDGLLCCAGIGYQQFVLNTDGVAFDEVMAVNVRAVYLCCREAFRHMKEQRSGSLVLVASRLATAAYPNMVPYITSKGAVVSMARALAVDLGPHGIRVNSLSPGPTETPMLQEEVVASDDPAAERRRLERQTLLGGIIQPIDIARAAAFLLSDDSRFVTGSTLTVDGGSLARIYEGAD